MSKKKVPAHHSKQPVKKNPVVQKKEKVKTPSSTNKAKAKKGPVVWVTALMIAICGSLLYTSTAKHDFNLDDFSVIVDNKMTEAGKDSLGAIFKNGYREGSYSSENNLYRPFTKAMFAYEYDLQGGQKYFKEEGGKPRLMHWVNIILYGLLCGFIFLLLHRFLPDQYYLALIATLLFTFHPIHTEVVANIKSRDELLSMFFILVSLWFAKSYADSGKNYWIIPTALFFFAAMLTKESAITYVALLPITIYFFSKASLSKNLIITVCILAVTGIYLYIHNSVIGSVGIKAKDIPIPDNSIMESKDNAVRRMTAIEIMGRYLKLLIFPHPLSCDYSFKTIPLVKSAANGGFLISFLLYSVGLFFAIRGFKKKAVYSYAILFFMITASIISNVFIYIGTNMAERLMFLPSLGFCILIAYLISKLLKADKILPANLAEVFSKKALVWVVLAPILLLFSFKTIDRNKDWKNVSTLFNEDVKTVPNSVHMLYYHANMITNSDSLRIKTDVQRKVTLELAEKELQECLKIYEPFAEVHGLLGKIYQRMGNYEKAIVHYKRRLKLNDKDPIAFNNFGTCYGFTGQYKEAEENFKKAIEMSPFCYADALCNLGAVYITLAGENMKVNKPDEARKYFNMAIDMCNQTIACDKNYPLAYQYLGVVYQNLGDTAKSNSYYKQYQVLQKQKDDQLKAK